MQVQRGQFAAQALVAAQPGPLLSQVLPASQFSPTPRAPFSVQAPAGSCTPPILQSSVMQLPSQYAVRSPSMEQLRVVQTPRVGNAPTPQVPWANGQLAHSQGSTGDLSLQAEVRRRQAAETRVQDLEGLVARLRQRIAVLEGKRPSNDANKQALDVIQPEDNGILSDPIDRSICEYLERNPDFPVSVQKVAPNYYVFGDRGTVYVTQRGEHIVVRVGGGFKSLQVFMDERALMLTREAAAALSEKSLAVIP